LICIALNSVRRPPVGGEGWGGGNPRAPQFRERVNDYMNILIQLFVAEAKNMHPHPAPLPSREREQTLGKLNLPVPIHSANCEGSAFGLCAIVFITGTLGSAACGSGGAPK
jgi:hypothetical protein